jgi:hypothetical protein
MSRICNILGLVVLGIALLIGMAAAGETTGVSGDVPNAASINVLDADISLGTAGCVPYLL